jgi:hypothetical protein
MSKLKLWVLIGLVVSVGACGGQATPASTIAPTAAPTVIKVAPPTAAKAAPPTAVATAPNKPQTASAPKLDPAGMCKASAGLPTVPNFPAALPADQARGSDQAPAVMYEYSDFQ